MSQNRAGEDRIDLLIRHYHALGLVDRKIAERVGRCPSVIQARRRRLRLQAIRVEDHDDGEIYLRAAVYREICVGHITAQIAENTGATIMQVEMMRRQIPRWWSRHYRNKFDPRGDF